MTADDDLNFVLDEIERQAQLDPLYFLCQHPDLREVAEAIKEVQLPSCQRQTYLQVPLEFDDRLSFCLAPVNTRDNTVMLALLEYATVYSRGHPVPCRLDIPERAPLFLHELKALETAYQVHRSVCILLCKALCTRLHHCGCGCRSAWDKINS